MQRKLSLGNRYMKNCWLPYLHAEIHTNGVVDPCCKTQYFEGWSNITDYHNADRSEFEKDKTPICKACDVTSNQYSYKKQKINFYKNIMKWQEPETVSLKSINLSLDNVCASSCIMCNSSHSTTIAALLGKHEKVSWDIDLLDPYLENIEVLHISGGEPLQSPNLIKFCEKIKKTNIKEISLCSGLSSNILTKNLDALCDLNIPIFCRVSIDAPWDLNKWIRGLEQSDWEKNLSILKSRNIKIGWQITIGAYNVFALPELFDYLEIIDPDSQIMPSPIIHPNTHAVKQLPLEYKIKTKKKLMDYLKTKEKYREIIITASILLNQPSNVNWNYCKSIMEKLPFLRNESHNLDHFIEKYINGSVAEWPNASALKTEDS
jgi:hypothetical protein